MALSLYSTVKGLGQPVILLHGLFGASDNLGRLAARLSENYEIHALDLRNHGNSPFSDEMDYGRMAEDVLAYADMQGLAKVHLLGHSMGGKVAMQFALAYPDRVNKLIVVDIAPLAYPAHHEQIFKGLLSIDLHAIKSRSDADKVLLDYVSEIRTRQFLLKNLEKDEAGHFTWRINLNAIYLNYQNILSAIPGGSVFSGSVLFVSGGLSDYLKVSDRETIVSLFPKATTRVIPNTSHWLHVEKPDLFSGICERFLKEE